MRANRFPTVIVKITQTRVEHNIAVTFVMRNCLSHLLFADNIFLFAHDGGSGEAMGAAAQPDGAVAGGGPVVWEPLRTGAGQELPRRLRARRLGSS